MLKQLSQLTVDAAGRYATAQELQFLKDYLNSIELRISTYQKIAAQETEILADTAGDDMSEICFRDLKDILRCSAGTVLIGDLDRMREGMLIWYQTIVRAYNYEQGAAYTYKIIQDVIKQYLTPEEAELIVPIFQLEHTILSV